MSKKTIHLHESRMQTLLDGTIFVASQSAFRSAEIAILMGDLDTHARLFSIAQELNKIAQELDLRARGAAFNPNLGKSLAN